MKKLVTLGTFLVVLCFSANAQSTDKGNKLPMVPPATRAMKEANASSSVKGISPFTGFLILDMDKREKNPGAISEAELIDRYALIKKSNKLYANSFILGTEQFSISDLRQLGVLPGSKSGKVYTALVPIDKIKQVAGLTTVKYLEIGSKVYSSMDSARSATGVDKAHQGLAPLSMPYTGKDVVVGVIDGGFDVTHPNFYDTTGIAGYRIKRFWKQDDISGAPPTGYAYGTEFTTESAILSSKTDDSTDNHGSHTSGIAAGAGGYPGSPYKGVAYESDIVLVGYSNSSTSVADGITYIQEYAASVGKPCVINMSFSTDMGPHDGTTLGNQFEDSATGPGRLLVRSAGNHGSIPLYLERNYTSVDTVMYTFLSFRDATNPTKSNGAGIVLVYGQPNQNISARLLLFNSVTGQVEDAMNWKISGSITSQGIASMMGSNGVPVDFEYQSGVDPLNNKPSVGIFVDNSGQPDGTYKIFLEVTGHNTTSQMWGTRQYQRPYFTSNGFLGNVYAGTTDHTVADDASGNGGAIVVGAYNTKTSWTALNGSLRTTTDVLGDIAIFSSKGPTADGRRKPDISAPGNTVFSSVNSFSPVYHAFFNGTIKDVTVGQKTWYFGGMSGTSMSTPMTTGIMALWLQQDPDMTREEAIERVKATAITDNFTGAIPADGSNVWGWGKINAFAGLVSVSVESVPADFGMKIYPNPATTMLNIAFEDEVGSSIIVLYDITGKVVLHREVKNVIASHVETINTGELTSGNYILKISNGIKTGSYKVTKQ